MRDKSSSERYQQQEAERNILAYKRQYIVHNGTVLMMQALNNSALLADQSANLAQPVNQTSTSELAVKATLHTPNGTSVRQFGETVMSNTTVEQKPDIDIDQVREQISRA